jgi:putative addiction module killer protein
MAEVVETTAFSKWLKALRDPIGRRAVLRRIGRIVATDNFGDHAGIGDGVSELRIDVGPGYRVYYTAREGHVIWLLGGGGKGSQDRDIKRAKELAAELE